MARLTAALALALFAGAVSVRADDPTFTACSTADDCVSEANSDVGQQHCAIFSTYQWTDDSDSNNPVTRTKQFGRCVQCTSDCDCGVNQWCSSGPAVTSQWWDSTDEERASDAWLTQAKMQLAAMKEGNMKMKGTCTTYGELNDDEAARIGASCSVGLSVSTNTNNAETTSDYMASCGYVSDWQPTNIPCTTYDGGSCPSGDAIVENPNKNKPGLCAATVNGNSIIPCSADGTYWAGSCYKRTCQICSIGQTRCSGSNAQTCLNGQWVATMTFDETPRTVSASAPAQLEASLLAFLSLILVIGCLSCLATARAAKNMRDAASS